MLKKAMPLTGFEIATPADRVYNLDAKT